MLDVFVFFNGLGPLSRHQDRSGSGAQFCDVFEAYTKKKSIYKAHTGPEGL